MKSEKFTNYDEAEQVELHKIVTEAVDFLKKEYAPALDLLTADFAAKAVNKFLLQKKAEFLLDEKAIRDGFESEADRQYTIMKDAKEKEAQRIESERISLKLQQDTEREAIEKAAKEALELQQIRDKEDAEKIATLKAQVKAAGFAEKTLNL